MQLKTLAGKVGKTSKHMSDLRVKRSKPSSKLALALERATGISRLKFLYSSEYGEPWTEIKQLPEDGIKEGL